MHNQFISLILFCLISINAIAHNLPRQAFCCTSIADVVLKPLGDSQSSYQQVKDAYHNLPISWVDDKSVCPRIHQLLLHEIVTILDETDHEAFVQLDSFVTAPQAENKESLQGWIFKENIRDLDSLSAQSAILLPHPLSWKSPDAGHDNTVTLVSPYIDKDGVLYSAGTRFAVITHNDESYSVYYYNQTKGNIAPLELPASICFYEKEDITLAEKIDLFCDLLFIFANIPDACIPLVWGGASICKVWKQDDFYRQGNVWQRPLYDNNLYMGIDASSIIARVTQIAGIPYYCKNSITAANILPRLNVDERIERGDVIWIPGSLLVVSDIERNTVITAMSYGAGYGCLIEVPLDALFTDISTFDQLSALYQTQLSNETVSLTILNRDGSIARTVDEFKLLKLV